MGMTQKDRDALRSVVRGRFEILTAELNRREREVREAIDAQIAEEHAADKALYRRRLELLEEKARAIVKEGRALHAEAEAKGLTLGSGHKDTAPVEIFVHQEVKIAKAGELQRQRYAALRAQGRLNGGLKELELKIIEQILTADLSNEARDFLAGIPSVDDLLPMPPLEQAPRPRKALKP